MSHVVACKLNILDLDALADAVKEMGGEYITDKMKWSWWGKYEDDYSSNDAAYKNGIPPERYGTSDAGIIRFPDCKWEAGVYKSPNGTGYTVVYDFFGGGGGLVNKFSGAQTEKDVETGRDCGNGKNYNKLQRAYGMAVAKKKLVGRNITTERLNDGRIVMRAVAKAGRLG